MGKKSEGYITDRSGRITGRVTSDVKKTTIEKGSFNPVGGFSGRKVAEIKKKK